MVDSNLIINPVIGRGMDFPNVSLIVQVGLPSASDAYVHRVGRTARAGKDGRAVILLTQAESFFCSVNRQFKITPYPASDKILKDTQSLLDVNRAMEMLDDHDKQKAYSAYLGFMKGFMNKLNVDATGLVKMANELALEGMGCEEVPGMEKKTIG
jgi:ATP-dependent RNA helicase MSS116